MKSILWLLALLMLALHPAVQADCLSGRQVRLLHFNDFHGQLAPVSATGDGGVARMVRLVGDIRAEDPGAPVVLLFAGDLLQGSLSSSLFMGIPDLAIFGRMGVAAAVVGNHELDYGQDAFRRLVGRAGFPFLSANLHATARSLPLEPSALISTRGGPVIAVLGLTTQELLTTTHPRNTHGLRTDDPIEVARRLAPGLRRQSDYLVVLSHLGLRQDRRLARAVPGIDLIVGGHDHIVLQSPAIEGDVPIVQAGARGQWLGRVDLVCRDGRLEPSAFRSIRIDSHLPEDEETARDVARINAEAEAGLDEVIGTAEVELSADRRLMRRAEAPFGNLLADLARDTTGADVALFNGGGVRASIPAGPVTLKQVLEALPFGNELVLGRLSGAELLRILARSAGLDASDNPGGFLQVSGVRLEILGGGLGAVRVGSNPIDPRATYSVVVSDFLAAGGDGYSDLTSMRGQVRTGRLVADVLIDAFRAGSPIAPRVDGRIQRRVD